MQISDAYVTAAIPEQTVLLRTVPSADLHHLPVVLLMATTFAGCQTNVANSVVWLFPTEAPTSAQAKSLRINVDVFLVGTVQSVNRSALRPVVITGNAMMVAWALASVCVTIAMSQMVGVAVEL